MCFHQVCVRVAETRPHHLPGKVNNIGASERRKPTLPWRSEMFDARPYYAHIRKNVAFLIGLGKAL